MHHNHRIQRRRRICRKGAHKGYTDQGNSGVIDVRSVKYATTHTPSLSGVMCVVASFTGRATIYYTAPLFPRSVFPLSANIAHVPSSTVRVFSFRIFLLFPSLLYLSCCCCCCYLPVHTHKHTHIRVHTTQTPCLNVV